MNSEQKIKDALVALDKAVQEWYQENNPDNKEHYASAYIYGDDTHVCRITLNSDVAGKEYVTIEAGGRMKQYSVKGKFEIEFSRIVEAETGVEAEEEVAGTYRRILNNEFNVPGRPYDVRVEEVIYDQRTQNCD